MASHYSNDRSRVERFLWIRRAVLTLSAFFLWGAFCQPASAQTFAWDNFTNNSNFADALNWVPYPGGPPSFGDTAIFNAALANTAVNVDDGRTIDVMRVVDTATVDLVIGGGTGRMDLDAASNSLVTGDSFGDTATLNVFGGHFDTLDALIRNQTIVQVGGPNALWDSRHILIAGDTVSSTAAIGVGDRAKINTQGTLTVGNDVASGRAVVDGTSGGIGLRANWTVSGNVTVGPTAATTGFNFGSLTVRNGGLMDALADVSVRGTNDVGSRITVENNGELNVSNLLSVGPLSTLNLTGAGSEVEVDDIDVAPAGSINWTGGTLKVNTGNVWLDSVNPDGLNLSTLDVNAGMTLDMANPTPTPTLVFRVGHTDNGTLNINSGGNVFSHNMAIATQGTANGVVKVDGAGARLDVVEDLSVGTYNNSVGQLEIANGGFVEANTVWLGAFDAADGTVIVDGASGGGTSSTLNVTNDLSIGGRFVDAGYGRLIVQNGGVVNTPLMRVWSDGVVNVSGARINVGTGPDVLLSSGVDVKPGGVLRGTGAINADYVYVSGGVVAPGASIGRLLLNSTYTQRAASTATLQIEIDRPGVPGVDYDQLEVAVNAFPRAMLDLRLGGGYTPTLGDEFDFMLVGGLILDTFDQVTNVAQSQTLGLAVRYGYDAHQIDMRVSLRGDTDFDDDVDTGDLTTAIIGFTGAGGSDSTWVGGDFDGDGDTDTGDLTTAVINFTGASAANPNVPDLVYDPATGNVRIDADGADVISFSLQGGPFSSADFSELPAGLTDNIATQIGWTSFNLFSGLTHAADLGAILPVGLTLGQLEAALTTASYGLALSGGGGGGNLDLIIPEPATVVLMACGAMMIVRRRLGRLAG